MRELTQQEQAAMWLYADEYAQSSYSAIEFYEQLYPSAKETIDHMIFEICKPPNKEQD